MLDAPKYTPTFQSQPVDVGLAVKDMQNHMTDEGWQIFEGLQHSGYLLAGKDLTFDSTNVEDILRISNLRTVVIQDKREWDVAKRDFRDRSARFQNFIDLKERDDIFKLTILKDSHQRSKYHCQSAKEMGVHAWIVYYDPNIVHAFAPYTRPEHLIRTYHTINKDKVPEFETQRRSACLFSGAISSYYPLRRKIRENLGRLKRVIYLPHPGYGNTGCQTYEFYKLLNCFKVMICTQSICKYALRKLFEATACGCRVITDLKEKIPEIDDNLIRIPSDVTIPELQEVIDNSIVSYNKDKQKHLAEVAIKRYDYRYECTRLSQAIENLRISYLFPGT